jgi:hypothetical protein
MSDWITLDEAVELAQQRGALQLDPPLCCGRVPLTGCCSNSRLDNHPDRIESLLVGRIILIRPNSSIEVLDLGHYRYVDQVRVHWPSLAVELESIGFPELPEKCKAPATEKAAEQRGPTSTAEKIREAGAALIADGCVPVETTPWERFRELLCERLGVTPQTRGYGLDTIQNALRSTLEGRQAKILAENTESTESTES